MGNPLFDALGGAQQAQMPGVAGQFQRMMQQFRQFRSNFQGNPRQEVEKLLQSGKMSQQQLNQLQNTAQQFMQFIK
jgi:hypothetical protein